MDIRETGGVRPRAFARGASMVEVLSGVAVASALLAAGVPAFNDSLHNHRLRGAADHLMAELRWLVSQSLQSGQARSLTLRALPASDWCYGSTEDATCDCSAAAMCVVGGIERRVSSADYRQITLDPSVSQNTFTVQPRRGTITAGNVQFTAGNGKQLRVVVNGYGRIRACSPAGSAYLGGYPAC